MKLILKLTTKEIIERFAKDLSVPCDNIELEIITEKPSPKKVVYTEAAEETEEPVAIPDKDYEHSSVFYEKETVVTEPYARKDTFFKSWLDAHKLSFDEAAQLCGLSIHCIKRMAQGYWCRATTFTKVVKELGMTRDEAKKLKAGMVRHQKTFRKKEAE